MDYREKHDGVARIIHWNISRKYVLETTDKGYDRKTEKVIETGDVKLLWDFSTQSDRDIQARRPDIVRLIDRKKDQCMIIDIAVPGDAIVAEKENEKIEKVSGPEERNNNYGMLIKTIVLKLWSPW